MWHGAGPASPTGDYTDRLDKGCTMKNRRDKSDAKKRSLWKKRQARSLQRVTGSGKSRTEAANPNVEIELRYDNIVLPH